MRWFILIAVLFYTASASTDIPEVCRPFEQMSISEVRSSKYEYASSCKLLLTQIKKAKESKMPQKGLFFGYALQILEDLESFNINVKASRSSIKNIFHDMNRVLHEHKMIEVDDKFTVFKGLADGKSKVYRLYFDDDRLKVSKEEVRDTLAEPCESEETTLLVNTKSDCLSVRESPDKEAKQINCLKDKSELVTVLGAKQENGYIKVNYMGGTGWVFGAYTKSNKE